MYLVSHDKRKSVTSNSSSMNTAASFGGSEQGSSMDGSIVEASSPRFLKRSSSRVLGRRSMFPLQEER